MYKYLNSVAASLFPVTLVQTFQWSYIFHYQKVSSNAYLVKPIHNCIQSQSPLGHLWQGPLYCRALLSRVRSGNCVGQCWILSALDGDTQAFVLQCTILIPPKYKCILKLICREELCLYSKKLSWQFVKCGRLETQTSP